MPWRNARLAVRPGITGLWQICRHDRGEGDFSQWICYDVAYVRHMSFWLDMKIIFYTVVSCLTSWKYISMKTVLPNADHHCD
jgi:lipopolysaccharide/colanic/teichoic acid biosynthesis glycosyltransferase